MSNTYNNLLIIDTRCQTVDNRVKHEIYIINVIVTIYQYTFLYIYITTLIYIITLIHIYFPLYILFIYIHQHIYILLQIILIYIFTTCSGTRFITILLVDIYYFSYILYIIFIHYIYFSYIYTYTLLHIQTTGYKRKEKQRTINTGKR